jgi:hypothetical protein
VVGDTPLYALSGIGACGGWFVGDRWLHTNVSIMTTEHSTPTLTSNDRCDACGAQAYVRVELAAGGELNFCAHHARKHGSALEQVARNIHDETARLHADASKADAR